MERFENFDKVTATVVPPRLEPLYFPLHFQLFYVKISANFCKYFDGAFRRFHETYSYSCFSMF